MSVYFAQREADGLIKIGWSRSVKLRMSAIRAKVIGAVPGERAEEKVVHAKFAHLRVKGEWFRPGEELLEYIRTEAQGHKPDSKTVLCPIKLADSLLRRADRLADKLKEPGMRYTRSDVLRMSIHRGFAEMEAEVEKR